MFQHAQNFSRKKCMYRADILIIDDTAENLHFLCKILEEKNYLVRPVTNGILGLNAAQTKSPDIILLDVKMPDIDGYEVCRRLKENSNLEKIPVIFISARDKTFDKTKGFACGGVDYITKPFAAEEVLARVEAHLQIYQLTETLRRTIVELETEIDKRKQAERALDDVGEKLSVVSEEEAKYWGIPSFIGKSQTIAQIVEDVRKLQNINTNILILGESGTGKELVARAIHFGGSRRKGPFISVNCSAIPHDLFEATCFGHVAGAFTGAAKSRKGLFECADRGTLFLDEIGDMPLILQAKILRVLEERTVTPVGSNTANKIDIRIVAATNNDLLAKIKTGTFRQDLYFRVAGFIVAVPPLRKRKGDISLLARHFIKMFAEEMKRAIPKWSDEAFAALENYSFPGNIRELKNIIENAMIRCSSVVKKEHLLVNFQQFNEEIIPQKPSSMTEKMKVRNVDRDEKLILDYIKEHGLINNKLCRELLQSDLHQASYILKKMHGNGLLIREGKYRWSYYTLPKDKDS